MSEELSRRRILRALAGSASIGVAGCSLNPGSDDGQAVGCTAFGFSNTRTAPLSEVSVGPSRGESEQMLLSVSLERSELESSEAAAVNVYNPYDEVQNPRYTMPLAQNREAVDSTVRDSSGKFIKKTAKIGTPPISGEFRVVVEDSAGNELTAERFSFTCEFSE